MQVYYKHHVDILSSGSAG